MMSDCRDAAGCYFAEGTPTTEWNEMDRERRGRAAKQCEP